MGAGLASAAASLNVPCKVCRRVSGGPEGQGAARAGRPLLNSDEKEAPKAPVASVLSAAPQDAAERRQVAVMFCDLVGSTALSARMDPEDLREIISSYQNCVAQTVQRIGGFVAKNMGDGVLVYFYAERAVRAAGLESSRMNPAADRQQCRFVVPPGNSASRNLSLQPRLGAGRGIFQLLGEPRRALHARIAEAMESQFAEFAENQPELLARHCTEAGQIEKAVGLWGKAGQRSLERSALVDAAEQFRRALDRIAVLPSTPALRREEIKLQVSLIVPLGHSKRNYRPPSLRSSTLQVPRLRSFNSRLPGCKERAPILRVDS
jgi:hypothetical protein